MSQHSEVEHQPEGGKQLGGATQDSGTAWRSRIKRNQDFHISHILKLRHFFFQKVNVNGSLEYEANLNMQPIFLIFEQFNLFATQPAHSHLHPKCQGLDPLDVTSFI